MEQVLIPRASHLSQCAFRISFLGSTRDHARYGGLELMLGGFHRPRLKAGVLLTPKLGWGIAKAGAGLPNSVLGVCGKVGPL